MAQRAVGLTSHRLHEQKLQLLSESVISIPVQEVQTAPCSSLRSVRMYFGDWLMCVLGCSSLEEVALAAGLKEMTYSYMGNVPRFHTERFETGHHTGW
jgi:hypothetical protein